MKPHVNLFTQHPLAQVGVALAAGICAANYFPAKLYLVFAGGGLCSLLTVLLLLWRHRVAPAGIALLAAFFLSGYALATLEHRVAQKPNEIGRYVDNQPVTVTGVLDGPPEFARDRLYLSLRVERVAREEPDLDVNARVTLLAPFRNELTAREYASLQLRYGTRIRLTTRLDHTGDYHNPGVSPLAEYLDRRGYDAAGLVKSPAAIRRLEDTRVFRPLAWLYDWRARLQREIDSRFSPETAGVLDASLLGNRHNLSRAASERFREGGTFHFLVISGFHISFIGGVIFFAARRLTKRRSLQLLVPVTAVWAYSLAVGAEASVVRAALMFTFAALGPMVFRPVTSFNALGGAALVLLARNPKELFDPSFQLTFLSVVAIVVVAWPLLLRLAAIGSWHPARSSPYPPVCARALTIVCEALFWSEQKWQQELARSPHSYRLFKTGLALWLERHRLQRLLRYVFGAIVVSASVQFVLLPLMIVYFHRFSPAALILNVVVSALLAVLVVAAALALMLSQVSISLAAPLIKLADAINWTMVHSGDPFSSLGLGSIRLPEYSGKAALIYVIYFLPLVLLVLALSHWFPLAAPNAQRCRLHRGWVPAAIAQMVLVVTLLWHPFSAVRPDGRLRVDFLDVGQGDSALVTMPDGVTLLIDGGGRPSFPSRAGPNEVTSRIGETVVSEFLWWRGLSEIDYVLVTHADADHIDGLNDVLRNFSVRGAIVARRPASDPEFANFSQTVAATGAEMETVQVGDLIRLGDVQVNVLWPPAGGESSANNDSLVLRLQFGERSLLFTGDVEKAAEQALLGAPRQLRADVVKVPHHGSKSSSTAGFVLATRPEFAIISVGRDSAFGHPHKEVVDRWQAAGATVLTTGHRGTITLTTNGHDLNLQTFLDPPKRLSDAKQ